MAQLASLVRGLEPDLIVVTGFPRLIPSETLAIPRLGAINAHPASLPRYRGPDPIFWQFYHGEPELGFTIHRMENEFDTGPVLAQGSTPIGPNDTPDDVFPHLFQIAAPLLTAALEKVIAGDPGAPQDPARASYAPLPTVADRTLDWTRSAQDLHNQTRACYGSGALALIAGEERMVHRTQVEMSIRTAGIAPGETILTTADGVVVQTGDGALLITAMSDVDTPGDAD